MALKYTGIATDPLYPHDCVGKRREGGKVVSALFQIMRKSKKKELPTQKMGFPVGFFSVSTPLLLKPIRISLPILTHAELGQWRTTLEVPTIEHILTVYILKPAVT